MPVQAGKIIAVAAGGDLQAALNAAQLGDTIVLPPGARFTGNFTLPVKDGAGWILAKTSADDRLPPEGGRVDPSFAHVMPKLTAASGPVITAPAGAHHFRFIGIEIRPKDGVHLTNLVQLGNAETSLADVPHDIIFDRCYLHGDGAAGTRRGIALNSASTAIVDSYLSDFKDVGSDSQAIGGWNGPGPYKIVNNYLEAASENIMFGGADPTIPNLVPSDIEIRQNYISKPLSWYANDPSYDGSKWLVKNSFELKNAQRVLVDGNVIERVWNGGQPGFIIVLTPVNQNGGCPWCTVQDVTFINNVVRHSSGGFNMTGRVGNGSGIQQRVKIENNLFDDIDPSRWGNGAGTFLLVQDGVSNLIVNHNTLAFNPTTVVDVTGPNVSPSFIFTNNIVAHGSYGVRSYTTTEGTPTLETWFPGYVFNRNVIFGKPGSASAYPPDNFFPASIDEIAFSDPAHGDFHLSDSSPYRGAATDGDDIGIVAGDGR